MGSGMFQARVPASTAFIRDPRVLTRTQGGSSVILLGASTSQNANFWTGLGCIGDYQTAALTTKRTIVNATGTGGFLRGCIGGAHNNSAGTTTWSITIDGVLTTIVIRHVAAFAPARSILGDIVDMGTRFTTANHTGGITVYNALYARGDAVNSVITVDPLYVRLPSNARQSVRFDTSLKVECQMSAVDSAGLDNYAGVIWNKD